MQCSVSLLKFLKRWWCLLWSRICSAIALSFSLDTYGRFNVSSTFLQQACGNKVNSATFGSFFYDHLKLRLPEVFKWWLSPSHIMWCDREVSSPWIEITEKVSADLGGILYVSGHTTWGDWGVLAASWLEETAWSSMTDSSPMPERFPPNSLDVTEWLLWNWAI